MRVLSPAVTPLPPPPRRALVALPAGAVAVVLGGAIGGALEIVQAFGYVAVLGACFWLGAWAERLAYLALSRQGPAARLLGQSLVPLAAGAVVVVAPFVETAFEGGPAEGLVLLCCWPAGIWALGASVGSLIVTCIDVLVSALVSGLRTRLTLAFGLLVTLIVGLLGGLMLAARALEDRAAAIGADDLNITVEEAGGVLATIAEVQATIAQHPLLLYALLLVLAFFTALPSVVSASAKLADAVLTRFHPLQHAFDEVAAGERSVRVEEGGSREFRELASHFNRMLDNLELGERMEAAFGRYVGDHLRSQIRARHGEAEVPAETKDATVLFADIRGFTSMSEKLPPQTVVDILNRYFDRVVDVIDEHDGYLNKFIGDAVVVVFNGPVDQPDHASRAVGCVVAILEAVREMSERGVFPEIGALNVGAGINSGPMVCGNIGNARQMEYTVIGDAVNLASRVEGMTKAYASPLLITGATVQALGAEHGFELRRVDLVAAKGKTEPVELYEVLDGYGPAQRSLRIDSRERFDQGLDALIAGELTDATAALRAVAAANPEDGAAAHLLERCARLERTGLPDDWDGVMRLTTK